MKAEEARKITDSAIVKDPFSLQDVLKRIKMVAKKGRSQISEKWIDTPQITALRKLGYTVESVERRTECGRHISSWDNHIKW